MLRRLSIQSSSLSLSQSLFRPSYPIQRRNLSIHEYLAADLMRQYGIDIPKGEVAKSPSEAEKVAKSLGTDELVIKAQVLAGGRGKGHFDTGYKGGVKLISSAKEAKEIAKEMIGHKLITKQTGEAGKQCDSVYIVERKYSKNENYLAILMDRVTQGAVIVGSSQGGMDIETVAKESPDAIITTAVPKTGLTDAIATEIATKIGFSTEAIPKAADTIKKLHQIFDEKDATQIEINPLSETIDGKVLCMDSKFGFDDNAEFRQEDIFALRDKTQEDAEEVKADSYGLNFIKLDGTIGCLVNGAGLAMATMDIIKLNGGEPANFLDVGGKADPKSIAEAFSLIFSSPTVTSVLVNIFGGIVRCDLIAEGLIKAVADINPESPIVARFQGTNAEQANEMIKNSDVNIFAYTDLDEAAGRAVQLSKLVSMAKEIDVKVRFEQA